MIKNITTPFIWAGALSVLLTTGIRALTIDFEDLPYYSSDYENGSNLGSDYFDDYWEYNLSHFDSRGAIFQNIRFADDDPYFQGMWHGWAYSKDSNTVNPGYDNSYSSATGTGAAGSASYALLYHADFMGPSFTELTSFVQLPTGLDRPLSLDICNTAWTVAYMEEKFPGNTFSMTLTIKALDAGMGVISSRDIILGDGMSILKDWTTIDLSGFGSGVNFLDFTLSSTDAKGLFMNPPAYVAVDNIVVIPEVSSYLLPFGVAALGMIVLRRRK